MKMNPGFHRTGFLVLLFVFVFFLPQCKKESQQNEIPVIAVSIALDPNSTEYIRLNSVNGWEYLTGGYKGIIVFRSSTDGFMAYERACPYDWDKSTARINVDTSGITTVCPSCKSKFILLDGSPIGGPSPYPMKQYQTTYNGVTLFIYN
jgi:nitrite reductase/ring-hydroxylating ferredoxin subunit